MLSDQGDGVQLPGFTPGELLSRERLQRHKRVKPAWSGLCAPLAGRDAASKPPLSNTIRYEHVHFPIAPPRDRPTLFVLLASRPPVAGLYTERTGIAKP